MHKTSTQEVFQKQFDEIAQHYDSIEPVPMFIQRKVLDLIPTKRDSFLELGCGTGRLLEIIAPKFKSCTGLDFSAGMIRIAKKRLGNKIEFIHSPVEKMDFKKNSFDYIVCVALFHHLNKEQDKLQITLDKMKEILKPGGRILICDFVTFKILKYRADWIHDIYSIFNSIVKKDIHIFKKINKEPKIFRKHLKSERGMFFTKKEFYDIFESNFKGSRIGYFGNRRKLINLYYLVWDKK